MENTVETMEAGGRGCWIWNTVPSLPESRLGGVALAVSPAVEDTVETMEAGGEGVLDLEAGEPAAGGSGVKLVEFRAGRPTPRL